MADKEHRIKYLVYCAPLSPHGTDVNVSQATSEPPRGQRVLPVLTGVKGSKQLTL